MNNTHGNEKNTGSGLVWSTELKISSDLSEASRQRKEAIYKENTKRRKTAAIEKEIIWATIILYGMIIASFAILHLYGAYFVSPAEEEEVVIVEEVAQVVKPIDEFNA